MASNKKRVMSSTVDRQRPFPVLVPYLIGHLLAPRDLASFALCAHQVHEELRGFSLELMIHPVFDDAQFYTQERLTALVIQPGYWKLTSVMFQHRYEQALPVPPLSLRKLYLSNFPRLDFLADLTLLEYLVVDRHETTVNDMYWASRLKQAVADIPSEFVFGQWASRLKRLTMMDPMLLTIPSLALLPLLECLDLTGCVSVRSVDIQDASESLSTLKLNHCRTLRSVPPLSRFKNLTTLHLRHCDNVSDLSGLEGTTSIVTLHIYDLPFISSPELGPIGSLSNLQNLELGVCGYRVHQLPYKVFDITPLALCGQLVTLDLSCRKVADLSPLATCTNLRKVNFNCCPGLKRLTGLGSCTQLTEVSIRDSAVHCICDLIGCTRLTVLDVTRCRGVRLSLLAVQFWARGRIEGRSDIHSFMKLLCKDNVPGRETNNIPLSGVQDMRPTTSLCVFHGHNYDPLFLSIS
jgi:hypothetical protein